MAHDAKDKLLFLTGRLAENRLKTTVSRVGLEAGSWSVANIGIKVAALMTEAIVRNRLKGPLDATRVIVPGRSRMDLASLADHYGVPFERGPDELVDLPQYLGRDGKPPDFSKHDLRIFAEIVEAPQLSIEQILAKAASHTAKGADVIDIGCQPEADFPHLEAMVAALVKEGYKVSVDSGNVAELERGAKAGAHYVLSLDETTLDAVKGTSCVPILVPRPHGDLASLVRAIDLAKKKNIPHIADPILDPVHFGFTTSLERYAELRRQRPDVEILMGTGNLTELTDADSQGVTAMLLAICSELHIQNVLIVQVSPHTRRTIEEHDAARRLMFRAREDESLPKGYGGGLLSLHDLVPFPQSDAEITAGALEVRDDNFRIQVGEDGVHIYSRQGHHVARDPFDLFPKLGVEADGAHAFYLGYELAKAEIALALGKRYAQDNPLNWGIAADTKSEDLIRHAPEGATLKAKEQGATLEGRKSQKPSEDAS
ncbi:MAG: dihydropteroate synthase [Hyphomicrobium sp.]|nr:MAG: dihydropteroate synthase [Hyphomicrobium sp.]PPC99909.1 MAG: dihydropteroate synthase [Hyphomicrobium sp.]